MTSTSERKILKQVLADGRVISINALQVGTRCSNALQVVTLEGGMQAFWKRGDIDPPGVVGVRREIAAYELAQLLGWEDLLQLTVLRTEPIDGGGNAEVACVELLPDGAEGLAVQEFDWSDVERAGTFDAVIANPDRTGHNWRGINEGGAYRLKLYDHELAFALPESTSSSFWSEIGQAVPEHLRSELDTCGQMLREVTVLDSLLAPAELVALRGRIERLTVS